MNMLTGFNEIQPESKSGIYLFTSENYETIYYVGQSINVKNRYSGHTVRSFLKSKEIKFKFLWKECETECLDESELYTIKELVPTLNHLLNEDVVSDLKTEYQQYLKSFIKEKAKSPREAVIFKVSHILEKVNEALRKEKECLQREKEYMRMYKAEQYRRQEYLDML